MISLITTLLFWSFMSYGMSTIIVYGSIFETTREWLKTNCKFLGDLTSCIMCTSTWVGFFLSLCLGGLTTKFFDLHWFPSIFFDGMFTTGIVWTINTVVEHFE